ncbi:PAS domain S-box protein, partial [Myxococcota bacterium]|nr:PAS domain S-box protein [Myxococcota bacterium]
MEQRTAQQGQGTIVVVDDSRDNLLITKKIIEKAIPGVEVVIFQHPEEAMGFLQQATVSLAILDMQMPAINGLDMCKWMKSSQRLKHIPVMLITSHNPSPALKAQGLEAGADDFLMRPIDNIELVARVQVALRISHAEAELRVQADQVQEEYQLFFEKMRSGFAVHEMLYDDGGNPVDYRFLKANPAFETHTGLKVGAIVGKTAREVIPGLESCWVERYHQVLVTGAPVTFEEFSQPLGKHFEVSAFAIAPTLFAVSFADITEKKLASADRNRLLAALEQTADSILITNTRGEIEYVNTAFEKITGYTQQEVRGKNPRFLKSGEHDAAFYRDIWTTLERGAIWSGKIINRKKDGTLFTEEAVISPVRSESGEIVNFVASKRDITREIALEDQLRQGQKMEAIGRLAGGIAHDFNNILV